MSRVLIALSVLLASLVPAVASEVDLAWNPGACPPGQSCDTAASFQVVRCTGVGCVPTKSQPVAPCLVPASACTGNPVTCTCADTTVVTPNTYRYAAYAIGVLGGQSGFSNIVDATMLQPPPGAPGSLTVITIKP